MVKIRSPILGKVSIHRGYTANGVYEYLIRTGSKSYRIESNNTSYRKALEKLEEQVMEVNK